MGLVSFIWLAPICLLVVYLYVDPFKDVLISNKASLSLLSPAQRANIELAARALDGVVIAPGALFSFNKTVGPRTFAQGYLKSPSYISFDTPMTFGGGVCLVSSMLYKNALELGLAIKERTAHTRTTQCVAPGFDATVWYGQNDLKLVNNLGVPLKLQAQVSSQTITLNVLGTTKSTAALNSEKLKRIVSYTDKSSIEVSVLRDDGNKLALISRDRYWLPGRSKSSYR